LRSSRPVGYQPFFLEDLPAFHPWRCSGLRLIGGDTGQPGKTAIDRKEPCMARNNYNFQKLQKEQAKKKKKEEKRQKKIEKKKSPDDEPQTELGDADD
jgi:hypothetical protein